MELRTARANAVPLSLLRRGGKARWTGKDRTLAIALTVYEDGLCVCGHPRDAAWDESTEGEWDATKHMCQACAAAARATDGEKSVAGRYVSVERG